MQRVGKGFVFLGALVWIVAGTIIFTSPRSGDSQRVAHTIGMQVATANTAFDYSNAPATGTAADNTVVHSVVTDGSGPNAWEGPYYVADQNPPAADVLQADVVEQPTPWYVQVFGGFGAMFQNLLTEGNAPGYGGSISQGTKQATLLPPVCTISIIPNSVPYGGSATVTWTTRNADHVIFQGIGEVARSGALPVSGLTSTRALALAVVGAQGSSSCYTVVNVDPVVVQTPTCVISAHPSEIKKGESTNISWGSENAASATLSDQGPVQTIGGATLSPTKSTTYTLTVTSIAGDPVSCDTAVKVD